MRIIILILVLFCSPQGLVFQNDVPSEVHYKAASRGSDYDVTINKDKVTVVKGLSGKSYQRDIKSKEWDRIVKMVKEVPLLQINSLTVERNERSRDAAATAGIEIKVDGITYRSVEFDHGSPPDQLQRLVKAVLSLANTVEKQ